MDEIIILSGATRIHFFPNLVVLDNIQLSRPTRIHFFPNLVVLDNIQLFKKILVSINL